MALTSYPNITISATNTVITPQFNGAVITSTYGSSVSLTYTAAIPANFQCWVVQLGAAAVWVTAGSGATVNGRGGLVATNGQYAATKIIGTTDGNCVVTGDIA